MIRSIDIQDWDGLEAARAVGLDRVTLLICPDGASARATLSAIWLLRPEETYAGMFEEIWHPTGFDPYRRMPLGWSFRDLLPRGAAQIRAEMDDRSTSLRLSVSDAGTLVGMVDGSECALEMAIDAESHQIIGLRGVPSGPHTMVHQLFASRASPDAVRALPRLSKLGASQVILTTVPAQAPALREQVRSASLDSKVVSLVVECSRT